MRGSTHVHSWHKAYHVLRFFSSFLFQYALAAAAQARVKRMQARENAKRILGTQGGREAD